MPFVHGSKGKFYLGTFAAPTTVGDISAYLMSVSFPRTADTAESSTFGNLFKTYVPGLTDAKITLGGRYDPTIDAQLVALMGVATVDYRWDPQGSTSGLPRYSGSAFPTSYEVSGSITDISAISFELQCITAVTRGTVP